MMMTNSSILSQQCNDPISYSHNQKVAMTKTSNHQKKVGLVPIINTTVSWTAIQVKWQQQQPHNTPAQSANNPTTCDLQMWIK